MNMTFLKRARCMLSQAGLSNNFWDEAVNMACHMVNKSSLIVLELKIPNEVWSSSPADYSKLRVFS
jgi:hypothetical protein